MSREALQRVTRYWETLTAASVERVGEVYAIDAYFRDPFNEVHSAAELAGVLRHMFATLDAPAFKVRETLLEDGAALLVWDFTFRVRALKPEVTRTIHGVSHLRFAADGRVAYHRDYWDAAGELYATLPLIGPVVRWLARKLGTA